MFTVDIDLKRFPSRTPALGYIALRRLHFSIEGGEFVCLIGPSGCGKSTLLNIINGLDRDYQGTVGSHNGVSESYQPVATVFQSPRLMPWLSVIDNVRLVMSNDAQSHARARELLAAMELTDVLNTYPNRLSGGMQRRVALARAFAIAPQLLLLDEPFVSLDAPVANRLRNMLTELWQAHGATVLFVTHDLNEALALADRVIFLSSSPGRIVLEWPVNLPRPRHCASPEVMALHKDLLAQYPGLLAGLANPDQRGD